MRQITDQNLHSRIEDCGHTIEYGLLPAQYLYSVHRGLQHSSWEAAQEGTVELWIQHQTS